MNAATRTERENNSFISDLIAVSNGSRKIDLTSGGITRNLMIVALPQIFVNVMNNLFNLIDMFWVGRLSSHAIAAVAMSGTVMMLLFMIVMGAGTGAAAMIARAFGAGFRDQAEAIAGSSVVLSVLLSVPVTLAGIHFAPDVLRLIGADALVVMEGSSYLEIIFAGTAFMFMAFVFNSILQGAGDTVSLMVVMTAGVIINTILDPFLIFGWGPFPRLGVAGAAWATLAARIFACLAFLLLFFRGSLRIRLTWQSLRPNWRIIGRIIRLGVPNSLQLSLRGIMGVVMMAIVAGFGTLAVAAYGIGWRVVMLALFPGFGFAIGAATLTGQNLGARKPRRAWDSAYTATALYMMFLFGLGLLFFILPDTIIRLFDQTPQVVAYGAAMLRITAAGLVFMGPAVVLSRSLVGAGDTISPLIITGLTLWGLQVPLAMVLPDLLGIGVHGVFLATVLATIIQGAVTTLWFTRGRWVHKKVL
ncbi:MATE family efflux transporter [bacterium]|nr:MATE family efflux transporter [candidate division CSSED10-310 bacterium]